MIYHVFANRSNAGDWLSAKAIQAMLGADSVTELLCDEPFVPETLRVLAGAGPGDFVVIGGGGLFMDYFAGFWEGFEPLSRRLRFALWGVGYCDLKREPSQAPRELLAAVVKNSRWCIVRDELSRGLLGLPGLPEPVPCPSLNILEPVPSGFGLLHVDNYNTAGAETYEVMDAIGRRFAEQTERPFLKTNNRIAAGQEAALNHCRQLYARADLVLSSALHGCVIAVGMGKKVLAVSGDRKIDAFMAAMGLSGWVLDAHPGAAVERGLSELATQPSANVCLKKAREANLAVAEVLKREMGIN